MKMIFSCFIFTLMLMTLPLQAVSANLAITTPPLITDSGVDTPYTLSFTASGGSTPYTWKGSGILPPGLSLSAGGTLSGTPTSMGSYDFTVQVTDNALATVSKQIFMNVISAPLVMPSSHPTEYGSCTTCHGAPNLPPVTTFSSKPASLTSYNYATFAFSANKTATFECSLDGAAMASCVSPVNLTALGLGSHTFKARATDSSGTVEFPPASYSWEVTNPSTILITTDANLPPATVGYPYSLTLEAAFGNHSVYFYDWYMDNGTSLPEGLLLDEEYGIISGAPTAAPGTYNFTLTLRVVDLDFSIRYVTKNFTMIVNDHADLTITTSSLSTGTEGVVYSQLVSAAGGVPGYTWSIVNGSGNLPAGLNLNAATGAISGEPAGFTAGTYNFVLSVTDSDSPPNSTTKPFSIVIDPALTITTTSLSSGTVGIPYSQTFNALYGTPPYTWTKNGAFPEGLSLSSDGVISGIPQTYGTFSPISLIVTDSKGKTANKTFNNGIVISDHPTLAITTTSLPSGIANASYSQAVSAVGGVPAYTWSQYSGNLPPGLSLNTTTGVISGTSTVAGTYYFRLKVTETHHHIAYKDLSILIYPALTITTETLPTGVVGTSYSQAAAASGGATPYTWAHTAGTLPTGLTFSAGALSGSPTTAGSYNFTLSVNDSSSQTVSKSYTVVINTLLTITTESLPSGVVGTSYSQAPAASGGVTPYAWTHTAGTLPPGLTFSAGVLNGTPASAGSYTFTLTVNDSGSQTVSKSYTVVVNTPLTITNASLLPSGTVGTPYILTPAASGGVTPYTWGHTVGTLPPGLAFNAGILNGTPTTAGSYTFTLTVNDSGSQTASKSFTVEIAASVPSGPPISIPGLPGTYSSVANAYAAVPANGTINIEAGNVTETLDFNLAKPFSLKGGYDPATGKNTGTTTITGTLTVRSGTLTIENIAFK